jgi:hypothetical protein
VSNVSKTAAAGDALRAEIRLLALLLTIFAAVKIAACSLAYFSAVVAAGGVDESGSQTYYWLPQVLYYTLLLAVARRLRRFEPRSRAAVLALSSLSIAATVLYTVLDFTIGHGRQDPAMAIAIKLRLLLSGGDVWDLVFPLLAISRLWRPEVRAVFASE